MKTVKKSVGLEIYLVPSNEYGIAISQSGTPIKFADDYQKIIDTRWRPLGTAIAYKVDFTVDPAAGKFKLFDHNLGFIPAFEAPRQTDRLNASYQSSPIGRAVFAADDTSIYIVKGDTFDKKIVVTGYIYVYNFPINEPFDSQYKGVSMANTGKSDTGMKINGNSEFSYNRLEDDSNFGFSVNTNNKQLNVAKVDVSTSNILYHAIPYPPLVKFSRKLDDSIILGYSTGVKTYNNFPKDTYTSLSMADSGIYVNAGTQYKITIYNGGSDYAYVIFRDPSEIAG